MGLLRCYEKSSRDVVNHVKDVKNTNVKLQTQLTSNGLLTEVIY